MIKCDVKYSDEYIIEGFYSPTIPAGKNPTTTKKLTLHKFLTENFQQKTIIIKRW